MLAVAQVYARQTESVLALSASANQRLRAPKLYGPSLEMSKHMQGLPYVAEYPMRSCYLARATRLRCDLKCNNPQFPHRLLIVFLRVS